jgi:hypothetical protein
MTSWLVFTVGVVMGAVAASIVLVAAMVIDDLEARR